MCMHGAAFLILACLGPKSLLGSLSTAMEHMAPYIIEVSSHRHSQIIKSLAKNSTK